MKLVKFSKLKHLIS